MVIRPEVAGGHPSVIPHLRGLPAHTVPSLRDSVQVRTRVPPERRAVMSTPSSVRCARFFLQSLRRGPVRPRSSHILRRTSTTSSTEFCTCTDLSRCQVDSALFVLYPVYAC